MTFFTNLPLMQVIVTFAGLEVIVGLVGDAAELTLGKIGSLPSEL